MATPQQIRYPLKWKYSQQTPREKPYLEQTHLLLQKSVRNLPLASQLREKYFYHHNCWILKFQPPSFLYPKTMCAHSVCVCVHLLCAWVCTKWVIASDKTTLVTCQSPSSHLVWNRSLCCFSVRRASVKTSEDFAISASHLLLREVVLDKTADSHVLHLVFMWFWRFKFRSSDLGAKCFSALSHSPSKKYF